ncbi:MULTISPECIES: hypothetical protein [Brasilonema]|jgi:hypothetical protein|nr:MULTISPECIES: hypothetical protein [Brasilonema]
MNPPRILQPGTNDTFSKYFELPLALADILTEFDCTYELDILTALKGR